MSKEFKPGDLALVISSSTCPECVGSVVTLKTLHLVVPLEESAEYYRIAEVGEVGSIRGWEVVPNHFFPDGFGALERNLMPLKGDDQPAQVRQAERVQ